MNNPCRPDRGALRLWVVLILILVVVVIGILLPVDWKKPVQVRQNVEEIYLPGMPLYTEDVAKIPVRLFFPDKALAIKAESREIYRSKEPVNRLRQVLVLLLSGPRTEDLLPIFPKGFRLRELYLYDGYAYIDLKTPSDPGTDMGCLMEYLTVTSIQESLLKNFKEVEKVKIVINGRERETLFGHIDIRNPHD